MSYQDLLLQLRDYWRAQGCVILEPLDVEVGAGTFHPATFFGALGKKPWRAAYVQPSRRPADGRYGDNPLRTYLHHQYQVILKPAPPDFQELYRHSLKYIGLDWQQHDLKFEKDDWKSPTLGATGMGWQVVLDGMEISQFTYFQQVGGIPLDVIAGEITYGTERIAMILQAIESFFDMPWNEQVRYGDVRLEQEREACAYSFEVADVPTAGKLFELFESEAKRCLQSQLLYPAYEHVCHCSHLFNILEARRAISVAERERFIQRIQELARACAQMYMKREAGAEEKQETTEKTEKKKKRA